MLYQPASFQSNNGIFQLEVSNAEKQTAVWTIDMKKTGTVYKGPAKTKAEVILILSDDVFSDLAEGKVSSVLCTSFTIGRHCVL